MLLEPMRRLSKAIVVIAVYSLVAAVGCSGSDQSEAPASSPSRPSPSPTNAPARMPNRVCCLGEPIEPATYASPTWFEVPISFEVEADWRGLSAAQEEVFALVQGENSIGHAERWMAFFVAPSVDQLVRELRSTPMLKVEDVSTVEVGGATGRQLDGLAETNPDQKRESSIERGTIPLPAVAALVPGFWYTESTGARLRFIALETDRMALLIYIEAPPSEFDGFSERAERVLESLRVGAGAE
jgi:hypothetical protein